MQILPQPFHPGELAAHRRAGLPSAPRAAIRDAMPEQHRDFFAQLAYVIVAMADAAGWPLATVLAGPPGFITSPDEHTLRVAGRPDSADPAAAHLDAGAPFALLGIDLATRRRNRANGQIAAVDAEGLTLTVTQSFGNCPQYIQARTAVPAPANPLVVEQLTGLDPAAVAMIQAADTFFVATASGAVLENGGLDVSHRGGRPGFLMVDGNRLVIPDFRGNRYFNTLGNIVAEPRCALLFIDFATGDLLQLQGRADILWDVGEADTGFAGAERFWRFEMERGWRRPGALPLRWTFQDWSPVTLATSVWG